LAEVICDTTPMQYLHQVGEERAHTASSRHIRFRDAPRRKADLRAPPESDRVSHIGSRHRIGKKRLMGSETGSIEAVSDRAGA
jgi:hypothetical protein